MTFSLSQLLSESLEFFVSCTKHYLSDLNGNLVETEYVIAIVIDMLK